jgi:hypothetical protein
VRRISDAAVFARNCRCNHALFSGSDWSEEIRQINLTIPYKDEAAANQVAVTEIGTNVVASRSPSFRPAS